MVVSGTLHCSDAILRDSKTPNGVFQYPFHIGFFFPIRDSDILDYRLLEWRETKGGWIGKGNTFVARIQKSMSDQLWLEIPVSSLEEK